MCGTRAISYGWGIAHIRANNRAYERFGLAAVAGTPAAARGRDAARARRAARARPVLRRPPPRRGRGPRARRAPRPVRPEMRAAAVLATGTAAAWAAPALAPVVPGVAAALRVPTRCAVPGAVAITFDDGPHPQGTPAVLAALAADGRARDVLPRRRAGAPRSPALAAEVAAAGHAVAVHGDRHRNLLRRRAARRSRDDLARAAATIAEATGDASRSSTARRTASTRRSRCAPSARAAGRRCCGRAGAATGRAGRRPASVAREGRRNARGGRRPAPPRRRRLQRARLLARAPPAPCRACSTRSPRPACAPCRSRRGGRRSAVGPVVQRHAPVVLGDPVGRSATGRRRPMIRWHGWS